MRSRSFKRNGVSFTAAVLIFAVLILTLPGRAEDRYLDQIKPGQPGIRLVVFNPSLSNIMVLENLRRLGLFNVPDLTVIGVYHSRQLGAFDKCREYVQRNKLGWVKFHEITAEVPEKDLFKANAFRPDFEAMVAKADGIIFFGGPDIQPAIYGKPASLLASITNPYRHILEVSAVFHLLGGPQDPRIKPILAGRPKFAVLGICLGFQTINVGTGGTLIQDIWSEVYGCRTVEEAIALGRDKWHTNPYSRIYPLDSISDINVHTIELEPNGLFCAALGFKPADHPSVVSAHHQAVDRLGAKLTIMASSRDGRIVESVGHEDFPNVLGVQFHPEFTLLWDKTPIFRETPGGPLTSFNAILAEAPPSLDFSKSIWKWLAGKLVESHDAFKPAD